MHRSRLSFAPFLVTLSACGSPSEPEVEPPTESTTEQAVWVNGDFENDAVGAVPSGWTRQTNLNPGITDLRPNPQTLASLNLANGGGAMTFVVGGATESLSDPDVGTGGTLRFPKYGQRAARVNFVDTTTNGKNQNANMLRQTMTVGLGDVDIADDKVHVRFAIAPVLENPNHVYREQPYYFVRLHNITTNTTLYQDFNASGQPGVPWRDFTSLSGNAGQYTDWQLVDIAPGNGVLSVGDQVEILITAAGCSLGGHWGRVYVDAVGSGVPGLFAWATGPQSANAGSDVTYTINYKNGGLTTATGTTLDFVTPPNTTFQAVSLGGACTTPAVGATGTVSCALGTLANGAVDAFTVRVRINAGTANGTLITNGNYAISATGSSALVGPKVNTTVTSSVTYADVAVAGGDGLAAIAWGQATSYTFTVANQGPAAAATVNVTDTLPALLENATWTCSATGGGSCPASGSGNIAHAIALPVGAVATYVLSGNIVAGTGTGNIRHTASAAVAGGVSDPDTTNNSAVDNTAIGVPRAVTVTKTGAPALGAILSTPAGLSCGTACASSSASFIEGAQVMLTASPEPGATFVGWTDGCSGTATSCTLTISGDVSVGATFVGAPATATATGGASQATPTGTPFAQPLAVTVRDASNQPVPNVTVTFSVPGAGASATPSSTTAVTNASGVASITVTANATAGSYSASATVPGIAGSTAFALTNIGPAASIAVSGGGTQSATVGTAFASPLQVTVRDAANQLVPGAVVAFAVPGSGASATRSSPTATTDASGIASITATANTVAGAYTATATVGSVSASFSLTNTAGAPSTLALVSGDGQSAVVGAAFGTALVAALRDAHGNAISGATISFSAPGTGASASLSAPALTDGLGRASVTATANTVAGGYSITASSAGVSSLAFTATNLAGAAATIAVGGGTDQSTTVGTAFASPLAVTVRDSHGNPVAGASVAFAGPGSGAGATMPASATSNASGVASVTATANTTAGSYAATATLSGAPPVSFALANTAGPAASIAVVSGSPQSTSVTTAFAPLVAVVHDAFGNPVPGVAVTYAAPATGARATFADPQAVTNALGRASKNATAGTVAGSYVVTVSAQSLSTSFALTNTPGPAAAIAAVGGGAQSTTIGTAFAAPLVVEVRDAHTNLVTGAAVAFAPPSVGASASVASGATTGSDGRASVAAAANTIAGAYSVTATVASATAQFQLTNLAGAPVSISLAGGDAQSTVVDEQLAQPLAVIVRDASGNPVGGVTVTFATPAATSPTTLLPSQQALTASDGRATLSARAGTLVGAHQVDASIPGASDSFHLTNLPGAPAAIRTVATSSPQSAMILTAFAVPLEVIVEDRFGNACPGADVEFAVPAAPAASASLTNASTTTDAAGRASVHATATSVSGAYLVTASVGGVADPAAFALTNLAGAPSTIVADSGSGQSAVVGTAFAAPIVARVLDALGNPVPDVTVTFTGPQGPQHPRGAVLAASSVVTDANGRAATALEANTRSGAYVVTATIVGGAAPASFALTNLHDVAASIIALPSATPQSATVATPYAAALAVRVRDRFANAVANATVTYAAPAGAASGTLSSPTATTDVNGHASVAIVAGSASGAFAVTATTPGAAAPAQFALSNLAGAARSIGVRRGAGQRAVVATAFTTPLVVFVEDEFGNRVPSATIAFAAPATGATAQLSATSVATDAAGEASVVATAGTVAGPFEVVATTPGGALPALFALTAHPGAPSAAAAFATSTPQSAQVLHAYAAPLTVIVVDAFGNRVPGVGLDLTVPDTGAAATLSSSTLSTGDDGTASVLAVANEVAGGYDVVVSVEGIAAPVAFALTNTPAAPHSLGIVSGGGQHAMATTAFAHPVVVRIQDSFGNAVPGATVALAMPTTGPSAEPSPGTVMTSDAAGRVEVALVANGHPGAFQVAASTAGAATPAQLMMRIDEIPTSLTVSLPDELAIDAELVATVAVTSAILVPAGDVEILDATGAVVAGGALDPAGTARLGLRVPSRGAHSYSARYRAQGAFGASSSATATVTVTDDEGSLTGGADGGGCNTGGGGSTGAAFALVALLLARRRRWALAALVVALPVATATPASAQPAGARSIDRLHAAAADSDWFALDSLAFGAHREVALSVTGDFAHRPLVIYDADGSPRSDVVRDAFILHVAASVSLRDRLRLSATAPIAPYQGGEGGTFNGMTLARPVFAFGDVTVAADVRVTGRPGAPLRAALGVRAAFPTGSRTNYMSDGVFGVEGRALVAGTLGRFEYASDVRLLVREQTELAGLTFGSELRYAAAAGVRLASGRLLVGPEVVGASPIGTDAATGASLADSGRPFEVGLGAHWRVTQALRVGLGASTGLVKAVGTPDARAMLSFAWFP